MNTKKEKDPLKFSQRNYIINFIKNKYHDKKYKNIVE